MSVFIPNVVLISNISNEQNATVTFTTNHNFVQNEYISFRVTKSYGMNEMNNKRGKVISLTSDTVTVNVDTTNYTPFTTPADLRGTTPPCAVPSSSGVNFNTYVPEMILNDCFDNEPV